MFLYDPGPGTSVTFVKLSFHLIVLNADDDWDFFIVGVVRCITLF